MAYTDALGTAMKCLGVASEIYEGNFDGSKYKEYHSATPEPWQLPTIEQIKTWVGVGRDKDKIVAWIESEAEKSNLIIDSEYREQVDGI